MLRRPSTGDFVSKRGRLKRTLGSMLTPEQMNLALQRESARVDRKEGGMLVLLLFRAVEGSGGAPLASRLAKALLHRIRVTDDVGWFDQEQIGVLLPGTTPAGAWRLAQQVCDKLEMQGGRPACIMYSYPAAPAADMNRGVVHASETHQMSPVRAM